MSEYDENEDEITISMMQTNSNKKRPEKYIRHLTIDAIKNRIFFLVILGLIVFFCICIANNGAVNGMEWIRSEMQTVVELSSFNLEIRKRCNQLVMNNEQTRPAVLVLTYSIKVRFFFCFFPSF